MMMDFEEIRLGAEMMFKMYEEYKKAGFTPQESMELIKALLMGAGGVRK